MPVFERETRVDAPLSAVWDFHSRVDGLEALTPDWMRLRVESVRGPDGDPDPGILDAGAEIELSVRPFRLGPRRHWTSVITDRDEVEGAAMFRDEMADGPFRRWAHTHSFFADGGATLVRDRVEYRLPLDGLGDLLGPLAVIGFEPMFRYRHRRTRELLGSSAVSGSNDNDRFRVL